MYVPNSQSNTVDVIDPPTYQIVERFAVGALPQHVVAGLEPGTLYVTTTRGNSLTPIDPRTGQPGAPIPVADPYNLYFTPDGRYAIVVAERLHRLDFRNPQTFALHHSLGSLLGVDHMDFTANGRYLLASCEFSGQLMRTICAASASCSASTCPTRGMPQDVKLSPDGRIFYVADIHANGVWDVERH